MNRWRLVGVGVLALLGCLASAVPARAHIGVAIGFGVGPGYYRPYGYYPHPYYYRPYPYYVGPSVVIQPAPVFVQPAPLYAQPAPTVVPLTAASPPPEPVVRAQSPAPSPTPADGNEAAVTACLQKLTNQQDQVRCEAVEQLGRLQADRSVDSLTAVLAGDRSPMVREAAARSLGLIGSPRALPALIRAAQADADRDVRRSAQFTVEIIHSRLRKQ